MHGVADPNDPYLPAIQQAITEKVPDGKIHVTGGGGHYTIHVVSSVFAGKNTLQRQRLVYSALTSLMSGNHAPVHAVDSMITQTPEEIL